MQPADPSDHAFSPPSTRPSSCCGWRAATRCWTAPPSPSWPRVRGAAAAAPPWGSGSPCHLPRPALPSASSSSTHPSTHHPPAAATFPAAPQTPGDEEPNDTYVEQLTAAGRAAVDEVVRRGVADPARVSVGGHSYGAFMTANLLAHLPGVFAAGIARRWGGGGGARGLRRGAAPQLRAAARAPPGPPVPKRRGLTSATHAFPPVAPTTARSRRWASSRSSARCGRAPRCTPACRPSCEGGGVGCGGEGWAGKGPDSAGRTPKGRTARLPPGRPPGANGEASTLPPNQTHPSRMADLITKPLLLVHSRQLHPPNPPPTAPPPHPPPP
jgi:hypothetical protein